MFLIVLQRCVYMIKKCQFYVTKSKEEKDYGYHL